MGQSDSFKGRPAVRHGYRVAEKTHTLRFQGLTVSINGSLLVDPATERLFALNVAAEDIPKALGITGLQTQIEFRPVWIGTRDLDMPVVTRLAATYAEGEGGYPNLEQTNHIEFRNCRQYAAESTISFGEEGGQGSSAANSASQPRRLPGGARLRIALETPIDTSLSTRW